MQTKLSFLLLFYFFIVFSFAQNTSYQSEIYFYHLDIPDHRVTKVPERILKFEGKSIKTILMDGQPGTYKFVINHNEINEHIFVLQQFISAKFIDIKDAVRSHYLYNSEAFLIYYNQNGFFPVENNEYYLINESRSKIYKLIPDGQLHEFEEADLASIKQKIIVPLCKMKNLLSVIPHDFCD